MANNEMPGTSFFGLPCLPQAGVLSLYNVGLLVKKRIIIIIKIEPISIGFSYSIRFEKALST
jgi:hypothetical protein